MRAIEFIQEYSKSHEGAIAGSYVLNQLIGGVEYNDIDYFTPLLMQCLDPKEGYFTGRVKEKIEINGKEFELQGKNYPKEFNFAAYRCHDFDDVPVNLVMVPYIKHSFYKQIWKILEGFDFDILRCAMSSYKQLKDVDMIHTLVDDCLKTKMIPMRVINKEFGSWHDPNRLERYKKKLSGYTFVEIK